MCLGGWAFIPSVLRSTGGTGRAVTPEAPRFPSGEGAAPATSPRCRPSSRRRHVGSRARRHLVAPEGWWRGPRGRDAAPAEGTFVLLVLGRNTSLSKCCRAAWFSAHRASSRSFSSPRAMPPYAGRRWGFSGASMSPSSFPVYLEAPSQWKPHQQQRTAAHTTAHRLLNMWKATVISTHYSCSRWACTPLLLNESWKYRSQRFTEI